MRACSKPVNPFALINADSKLTFIFHPHSLSLVVLGLFYEYHAIVVDKYR